MQQELQLKESELQKKESELQQLKKQLSELEGVVTELKGEVSCKDVTIEDLGKKLKHHEEPQRKSKEPILLSDGVEKFSLPGLSPEMLFVVSQDPHVHLFNFDYDSLTGCANFFLHSQIDRKVEGLKTFVNVYQHLFNSGQVRVGFYFIPPSFPRHFLGQGLLLCQKGHKHCWFEYMESIDAIKVVSESPEHAKLSSQIVKDQLSLTLTLPGGRAISLKKGDLVLEEVDAIGNPTNANLYRVYGISAALNASSQLRCRSTVRSMSGSTVQCGLAR